MSWKCKYVNRCVEGLLMNKLVVTGVMGFGINVLVVR